MTNDKLNSEMAKYNLFVAMITSLFSLCLVTNVNTYEGLLSILTVILLITLPWLLYFPLKSNVDNEARIKRFRWYMISSQLIQLITLYKFGFSIKMVLFSLFLLVCINVLVRKNLSKLEVSEVKNSPLQSLVMLVGLMLGVYTEIAGIYIMFLVCSFGISYAYFKVQLAFISAEKEKISNIQSY